MEEKTLYCKNTKSYQVLFHSFLQIKIKCFVLIYYSISLKTTLKLVLLTLENIEKLKG